MTKLVIYNHGKDSIPWGEKPLVHDADHRLLSLLPIMVASFDRFLDDLGNQ